MPTQLQEPKQSISPVEWLVYADWLYDQDDEAGAERARAIAAGIEKTGGRLWLAYGAVLSKRHEDLKSLREGGPVHRHKFETEHPSEYQWLTSTSGLNEDGYGLCPLSPFDFANGIAEGDNTAGTVAAFLDKLAEIGRG